VVEPKQCEYEVHVTLPDLCGLPGFESRANTNAGLSLEPWFMELSEVTAAGGGIDAGYAVCKVHSAGFAQTTPTSSRYLGDFALGLIVDGIAVDISHYDVRYPSSIYIYTHLHIYVKRLIFCNTHNSYGTRQRYPADSFVVDSMRLGPASQLAQPPNFLMISAPV
jgi:hypothetical protein